MRAWWAHNNQKRKGAKKVMEGAFSGKATSAPSECILGRAARVLTVKQNKMSEVVTSAMMYCRENRELLHMYYADAS